MGPDIPQVPSRSFYCTYTVHCTYTSYCSYYRGHTAWLWLLVNGAVTTPALWMHNKDVFTFRSMLVKSIHRWENLPGFLMGVYKWGVCVVAVFHLGVFQIKNRKLSLNNNGVIQSVIHHAWLTEWVRSIAYTEVQLNFSVFQDSFFTSHYFPIHRLSSKPRPSLFLVFLHERHAFFSCASP